MGKILSFEEIQRQYDGEWVIVAYTALDDQMVFVAGEVLAHEREEVDIYRALSVAGGRDVAVEYVGKVPDDLVFIL
jgi:hypothetical protein